MFAAATESLAPDFSTTQLKPFGRILEAHHPCTDIRDLDITTLKRWVWEDRYLVLRGLSPFINKGDFLSYGLAWGDVLTWDFGAVLDLTVHPAPDNYLFTYGNVPLHWGGAFAALDPTFAIFYCQAAPEPGQGGETLLCDTTRAWAHASSRQKELWRQIEITYHTDKIQHYGGQISNALVNEHPWTGDTIMRFAEPLNQDSVPLNPIELQCPALSSGEFEQLLDELIPHLHHPSVCVSHTWRPDDILIVDNNALLVGRNSYRLGNDRHLQRVQII